jgi:quercetin dioxygenase-like cupin family protein
MKPYIDSKLGKNSRIRIFDEKINPIELLWHRDLHERKVTILEGTGWKFQLDEKIPRELSKGDVIYIPGMIYHRIIKGEGDLKILIQDL